MALRDTKNFLAPKQKRSRDVPAGPCAAYRRSRAEAERRVALKTPDKWSELKVGDKWSRVAAEVWVGLYVACHVLVYDTEPTQLHDAKTFRVAKARVARFVERRFQDPDDVAAFVAWAFGRAQYAWKTYDDAVRMSVESLFSVRRYDDYRAMQAREG